jgi:lipoyl(octanoyl) transferase
MSWYDRFVPCGISDAGVTSLSLETGREVPVTEVLPVLQRELERLLRWEEYAATPDYEPRPEPGRVAVGGPRIEVLSPSRTS